MLATSNDSSKTVQQLSPDSGLASSGDELEITPSSREGNVLHPFITPLLLSKEPVDHQQQKPQVPLSDPEVPKIQENLNPPSENMASNVPLSLLPEPSTGLNIIEPGQSDHGNQFPEPKPSGINLVSSTSEQPSSDIIIISPQPDSTTSLPVEQLNVIPLPMIQLAVVQLPVVQLSVEHLAVQPLPAQSSVIVQNPSPGPSSTLKPKSEQQQPQEQPPPQQAKLFDAWLQIEDALPGPSSSSSGNTPKRPMVSQMAQSAMPPRKRQRKQAKKGDDSGISDTSPQTDMSASMDVDSEATDIDEPVLESENILDPIQGKWW